MSVTQITKKDWVNEVLSSDTPVMVKFGAPWCGPCKSMEPILETISQERTDVKIVDVNIEDEENDGLAQSFNVRGVPTMIIFHSGKEIDRRVGAGSLTDLNLFIDQ
jgi:thioredoxin 1